MSLLNQIRSKNPALASKSDEEIKSDIRKFPEFSTFTDSQFDRFVTGSYGQDSGSDKPDSDSTPGFTGGLAAGVDQVQGMGGGLIQAAGAAVESDALWDFGKDMYERNMAEAGENALDYGFTDIRGAGDAFNWARYTAGNLLPTLAVSLAGGGIGGVAGRVLAGEVAKQSAIRAGQGIGAMLASSGMETGSIMGETETLDVSLAHGVLAGSLDALLPFHLLRKAGAGGVADRATDEIGDSVLRSLRSTAAQSGRAAAGKGSLIGLIAEAPTEGLQGLIGQHANYWVENNGESLLNNLSEVDWKAVIDEAAAGGLMGGGLGAPVGLIERGKARSQVARIDEAKRAAEQEGGDALDQLRAAQEAERRGQSEGDIPTPQPGDMPGDFSTPYDVPPVPKGLREQDRPAGTVRDLESGGAPRVVFDDQPAPAPLTDEQERAQFGMTRAELEAMRDQAQNRTQPAEDPALAGRSENGLTGEGTGVYRVPVDQLQVDPDQYQFRSRMNQSGVDSRLDSVKKWDENRAGDILVHRRSDGSLFVADGHHRLDLAKRLGQKDVNVRILDEADGVDVPGARVEAAMANIADGKAEPLDVAKVFRDIDEPNKEIRKSYNLPNKQVTLDGEALANLSDNAFGMVVAGQLSEKDGAAVGANFEGSTQQEAAVRAFQNITPKTASERQLLVNEIRAAGFAETQGNQGGLFGDDPAEISLLQKRLSVLDSLRQALAFDKKLFGSLNKNAGRAGEAGNQIATEANKDITEESAKALDMINRVSTTPALNDMVNRAARRLVDGEKKAPVVRDLKTELLAYEQTNNQSGTVGTGRQGSTPVPGNQPATGQGLGPAESERVPGQNAAGADQGGKSQGARSEVAPDLDLETQTEGELSRRDRVRQQAEKAKTDQRRKDEKREQADAEAGDFTLSGSDSAVDKAEARGQENMFDEPGPGRRQDEEGRRRVNEMTDKEMRKALLIDALTGLGNRRAYAENERKPVQVSADADSLKWINDNMSHGAGDKMLEAIGRAFKAQDADAYHPSGDEFWLQARTEQEAERIMQAVASDLEGAIIEFELPSGEVITKRGIGISYGTAGTIETAEQRLQENKSERERTGQRSGRGEIPPGVTRRDPGVSGELAGENQSPQSDAAERPGLDPAALTGKEKRKAKLESLRADAAELGIDGAGKSRKELKDLMAESAPAQEPAPKQKPEASKNTIVTDDAAEKARAILKAKLGQMNAGLDPEMYQAGITLTLYHIEKGARTFSAYAQAMVADLGDMAKPYLKQWYLGAKFDPRSTEMEGLDGAGLVEDARIDDILAEGAETTPATAPDTAPVADETLSGVLYQRLDEITDNRKLKAVVADYLGKKPADVTDQEMKQAQEALEGALVNRARDIVQRDASRSDREVFDELQALYAAQPNLNVRSSSSMERQAYSTPAPLAFLSSRLAGITEATTVYEPTAGNGMLLIGAPTDNVIANELDPGRAALLEIQGIEATQEDATTFVPGDKVDSVIMNPPFGRLKDEDGNAKPVKVDGYTIKSIDHLIAAKALEAMRDDGQATMIIGASKAAGEIGAADRTFFNWLYRTYNVTSHFEVDGDLYNRQGAGWPVRVITINGRKASNQISPKSGVIERAMNWSEVYEQYQRGLAAQESDARGSTNSSGTDQQDTENGPIPAANGDRQQNRPDGPARRARGRGRVGTAADGPGTGGGNRTADGNTTDGGGLVNGGQSEQSDISGRPDEQADSRASSAGGSGSANTGKLGVKSAKGKPGELNGSDFQAPYQTLSTGKNDNVLTPNNMALPLSQALSDLEQSVGNLDTYVQEKLGYDTIAEMHESFMGLQVDAVAASIYNIENNKGIIIADQTGVGKGRQAAAIIRYARRVGKTPIFMSVSPNLFSDMYGDLKDIGDHDVKPFVVNAGEKVTYKEREVYKARASGKKHSATLQAMAATGQMPADTDTLFLTYSQITADNLQRKVMKKMSENAIFVLDEAHNVSGARSSPIPAAKGGGERVTAAGFMFELIEDKPVVYLSATFAKRPDNLPIYYRTDLSDAVDDISQIEDAMASGGLPLQAVISNMLARAGQLFRRERSFDGIEINTSIDTDNTKAHERLADTVAKGLSAINTADKLFHNVAMEGVKEAEEGAGGSATGAGNRAGNVDHANFSSVIHNYIGQLLLGLKVERSASQAIELHKKGVKPVIALENTMGSFLSQYVEDMGLSVGDPVDATYNDILLRALDRSRRYSRTAPNGDKKAVQVSLGELDPMTRKAYLEAQKVIEDLDISDIPISPIDLMRYRMGQAGMKVSEITGRDLTLDYSTNPPTLAKRDSKEQNDKRATVDGFNSGRLDALVLNIAGSTGLSLHSASKFKDQKPRHMIVAQAPKDINILMQMLGRINRTGQVALPEYTMLGLNIPAEKRPLAVTAKKMKSLNANTSANDKSDTSVDAPDYLNKYGDQVVAEYLQGNPELALELDLVMPVADSGAEMGAQPGLAMKFTGRMARVPVETQKAAYDEVETTYAQLVEYLNKTGQNDLDPQTLELDAKILDSKVVYEGKDPTTIFGGNTTLHKIDAKYLGKPPTGKDVRDELAKTLKNTTEDAYAADLMAQLQASTGPQIMTDRAQERVRELDSTIQTEAEKDGLQDGTAQEIAEQAKLRDDADIAKKYLDLEGRLRDAVGAEKILSARLQDSRDRTTRAVNSTFKVGERVMLDLQDEVVTGVVTEIKINPKGKGDPYALSKTRVSFMVNSGVRTIDVPLSKLKESGAIYMQPLKRGTDADLDKIFKGQGSDGDMRETRFVATGNLIAAAADSSMPGRIIAFTDSTGKTHQGKLLPRRYEDENFDEAGAGQYMVLRDKAVLAKFLKNNPDDIRQAGGVFDPRQLVRLIPKANGKWAVTVAKANKEELARKVKFNQPLLSAMGMEFYGSGKTMEATFSPDRLNKVTEALASITPLSALPSLRKQWEKAGGKTASKAAQTFDDSPVDNRSGDVPAFSLSSQTDTDAFQKWFGGSKIVDESGQPLTVYHGTNATFTEFSRDQKGSNTGWENTNLGFYFIADRNLAQEFANESGGDTVMDAYLSIQKPLRLTAKDLFSKESQASTVYEVMTGERLSNSEALDAINEEIGLGEMAEAMNSLATDDAKAIMERDGYDGVISDYGDGTLEYVAFNPEQIRLADQEAATGVRFFTFSGKEGADVLRSDLSKAVSNVPELASTNVIESTDQLPKKARDEIKARGIDPASVRGLYVDDQLYVVAGNIETIQDGIRVAVHEAVGHKGIRGVLGESLDTVMLQLYRSLPNTPEGRAALDEVKREYTFLDPAQRDDRIQIAEEMVAHLLEKGHRPKAWQRAVSKIRELLRRLIPSIAWTHTDVLALGEQSREHLRQRKAGTGDAAMRYSLGSNERISGGNLFGDFSDADKAAAAKIGPRSAPRRVMDAWSETTHRAGLKLRQGMVDRLGAFKQMDEQLLGEGMLGEDIARSSWVLGRMANAANGALHTMLHTGRIILDPTEKVLTLKDDDSKGLGSVFAQLASHDDPDSASAEVQRFMGWIAGNRARKLKDQGRENLFTDEDITAMESWDRGALADGRNRAETYADVFEQFQAYRDDVLAIADQAGLLRKGMSPDDAVLAMAKKHGIRGDLANKAKKARKAGKRAGDIEAKEMADERESAAIGELQEALVTELGMAEHDAEYDELITDQRELWGNEFYVPFYRINEDEKKPSGQLATGGLSRQQAYKRLKGGTQNLNDLLENTMMNFHHLLDASLKNQAAQQAVENAKLLGMARKVPAGNRNLKTSTFVLEEGEQAFYQIDDPLVFEALTALSQAGMNNMAMKIMRGFKRLFTQMTTSTPQFMVANLIRDTLQASATSDVSKNVFANVIGGTRSYNDLKNRAQMMASGASFNFGHIYGSNPDELRAQLTRDMRGAKLIDGPQAVPDALVKGWQWWTDVNNAAENINRSAIFTQNQDKGSGKLKAAFEARDLIDFSAHGAWPAIRILIDIVPFLNARIQGLDKIYRSGVKPGASVLKSIFGGDEAGVTDKQSAGRFWAVTGALAMATMALYLHNEDDEEYKKLEDWQKDSYWFIRFGDQAFFIPKPFEVGAIATMVERITEQFVNDEATGKLFRERMWHMVTDTFAFSPIPQAMQPALDIYANYDAFTQRPIESMGMDRLSPELRKRASTSKVGEGISLMLNASLGAIGNPDYNPLALSPVQVDHLIGGYLGQIGSWVAGSGDVAWRVATGHEKPAQRWYEYQPIRRFYGNLGDEDRYTKYGTVFYEGLREAGRAYADVKEMREMGNLADAAEVAKDKQAILRLRTPLNRAQSRLRGINRRIDVIRRSDMDGELKRSQIDRMRAVKNQIQRALGERVTEARAR